MKGPQSSDEVQTVLDRISALPLKRNREDLIVHVQEEIHLVEVSTVNARLDAVLALGKHLRQRPWLTATRKDIVHVITAHRFRKGAHRARNPELLPLQALAASTKYQWKVHMQTFYKWLLQTDDTPHQFRRLPFRKKDQMAERMQELVLKPEEIRQLLSGARCARDRAIIIVALETGFRTGEQAALRLDRMEKRKHGYWFELPSEEPGLKTGPRRVPVPVIAGARFLDEWLAEHPRKHATKPPLFVTLSKRSYGNRMSGKTIADAIVRCAKRAGMRHIWAHMLRHSSASLKVAKHVNPELIRLVHGWSERSNMLGYYTHVEGFYTSMWMEVHGLEDDEPELRDIIGSQPCLLCGNTLHVGDLECKACSIPNSDAVARSQAARQNEAAASFVAIELAKALDWNTEAGGVDEALDYLAELYGGLHHRGEAAFARWCLRQWASKCRAG